MDALVLSVCAANVPAGMRKREITGQDGLSDEENRDLFDQIQECFKQWLQQSGNNNAVGAILQIAGK